MAVMSEFMVKRKWGQNWPHWERNTPQDSLDGVFSETDEYDLSTGGQTS